MNNLNKIYLDNASSTPIKKEVIKSMVDFLKNNIGNGSSNHQFGRNIKSLIENSRILISNVLNASPSEIIFTSGGTEANNIILQSSVKSLKIKRIITSMLEHKSVLNSVFELKRKNLIKLEFVKLKSKGRINFEDLYDKLSKSSYPTLVSLMHSNNEIGNLLDIENIIFLRKKYEIYFHSDIIQSIGHHSFDMKNMPFDFASASSHKFYGPSGVGFIFIKNKYNIKSIMEGGCQEYGVRPGTENVCGIIGMAKALELSHSNLNKNKNYIKNLKKYCINNIKKNIPNIFFNGLSDDLENSLHTILSISIPVKDNLLAFKLDLHNIIISQGSACELRYSKNNSHVIKEIYDLNFLNKNTYLRISFSIFNNKKEIDRFISVLKNIIFN